MSQGILPLNDQTSNLLAQKRRSSRKQATSICIFNDYSSKIPSFALHLLWYIGKISIPVSHVLEEEALVKDTTWKIIIGYESF